MMIKSPLILLIFIALFSINAFPVTFSGSNVPFDSSFHLGLVSGPGTGLDMGGDIFFPVAGFGIGPEVALQVTNANMDQNINILKYGAAFKYIFSDDLFFTFHIGVASFYITKAVDYVDSFSGEQFTLDEETYGKATYLAFAPNFRIGDFILTPKAVVNHISEGGTLFEVDINLGHLF